MNTYRSCEKIESGRLVFIMEMDTDLRCVHACCFVEDGDRSRMIELSDDPKETVDAYLEHRHKMIEENRSNSSDRIYTKKCLDCQMFVEKDWSNSSDKISYINLSMAPAPCQANCCYCYYNKNGSKEIGTTAYAYERVFKVINYLKEHDMIADDAVWKISSGEVAIHPYKKEMIELAGDQAIKFSSNCFIFDQDIADKLKANKQSIINLSIDSGTAQTWRDIKGTNNFNRVLMNLDKYYDCCDQENYQQIELKYIVLPGINTNKEDYDGIIEIMKKLNVKTLQISRDASKFFTEAEYDEMLTCAINLAIACIDNNLSFELTPEGFTAGQKQYVDIMIAKHQGL